MVLVIYYLFHMQSMPGYTRKKDIYSPMLMFWREIRRVEKQRDRQSPVLSSRRQTFDLISMQTYVLARETVGDLRLQRRKLLLPFIHLSTPAAFCAP